MPLSPCHQLARDLKAAIDARMLGTKVQSVGHKGRTIQYETTPLAELIRYYHQVRSNCPDALADPDLIEINSRGGPARFLGRGYV